LACFSEFSAATRDNEEDKTRAKVATDNKGEKEKDSFIKFKNSEHNPQSDNNKRTSTFIAQARKERRLTVPDTSASANPQKPKTRHPIIAQYEKYVHRAHNNLNDPLR
jgi:hypothetical protein